MPVLVVRTAHVDEHTPRHNLPPLATFIIDNPSHPSIEDVDIFEVRVFRYFIEVHFRGYVTSGSAAVNWVAHLHCLSRFCGAVDLNFSLYMMLFDDNLRPLPIGDILLSRDIDKQTLSDIVFEFARYGTVGVGYLIIFMTDNDLNNLLTALEGRRICVRDDRRDEYCLDAVDLVSELVEKNSIFVHVVLNKSDYEAFRDFLPVSIPDYVAVIERKQVIENVCFSHNACIEVPKNIKNIFVGEKAIERIKWLVEMGLVEKKDLDLALRVLKETGTSQSS